MALCSFADRFSMFDVTPVENLFIEEYMLRASGDFVKVYLYGLRLCYHPVAEASLATIAAALGMEQKTVEEAFTYWERRGIVRKTASEPPAYTFNNLKEMMVSGRGSEDEVSESNRAFNQALQDLFGSRLLHAAEYEKMYMLMEDFGFSQDTLLLLTRHCIENGGKGTAVTFAFIEKEGKRWAKKGATTLLSAEEYLRTLSACYAGASDVLRYLGLSRAPSRDEEQLYDKWTRTWGFHHEAVLFSCREMTKIQRPNFSYLDKVLESRLGKQQMTSASMEEGEKLRSAAFRPVREVLEALGQKNVAPTEDDAVRYSSWLNLGFAPEAIAVAAKYSHCTGHNTLGELEQQLREYAKEGVFTAPQIESRNQREGDVRELLRITGARQEPTSADIALYGSWQSRRYGKALIREAASRAQGKSFAYVNTILERWEKSGITTVEAARREHEQFVAARGEKAASPAPRTSGTENTRPSKEVGAHRFEQRQYTEEELEQLLYVDIDKLNEPEE